MQEGDLKYPSPYCLRNQKTILEIYILISATPAIVILSQKLNKIFQFVMHRCFELIIYP